MDSKRLPGKVLLPILGKPVLWHIYNRLKFSKKIDEICISTSNRQVDEPIIESAKLHGIKFYRGSAENLVSRHLGAAKAFDADVIIRVTADDPLIDPEIIDQLISLYEKNPSADFISNRQTPTFPVGLEVEIFPKKTLEKLLPISDNQIFYEFFISNYIFEHPKDFISINLSLDEPNLQRWTLDYAEDYELIKQIYSNLYKPENVFYMKDILRLLEQKTDLKKINSKHYSEFSHLKYEKQKSNNENTVE